MRPGFIAAMLASVMFLGLGAPSSAQESTPSSAPPSCSEIEPRDTASFQQVAGTPQADGAGAESQATSGATPTPFAMPEGEVADDATVAEIAALYEQLVSCLNAGEFLRAYALYTDDYLVRNLSAEAIEGLSATPVPTEEAMRSTFGDVLDARMMDDGRVAALISTSNPQVGETIILAILTNEEGRWLIDDESVVEVGAQSTPGA